MKRNNFWTAPGLTTGIAATLALPLSLTAADADAANRKGSVTLSMGLDNQIASELAIREPSMCEGSAETTVSWNREGGWVKVKAKFDGLPYRPDFAFDDYNGNPGTPTDPMPDEVVDGVWQIWVIGKWGTAAFEVYWDEATGTFLGNEYDYPKGQPEGSIAAVVPAFQLICSPTFESNPSSLHAHVNFQFDYHQLLDGEGTGGTFSTVVPMNFYDPSSLALHAVVGGLPVEEAMDWDDVLDDIEAGVSTFAIYTSLEPNPKPSFIANRDNAMIGWAAIYNKEQFFTPVDPPSECGTYQLDSYYGFLPSPE